MAIVGAVILAVFSSVFAASADARFVRVMPKWVWVLVCLLIPYVGPIGYLTIGRPITDSKPNQGPIAPDDDPDFLNSL